MALLFSTVNETMHLSGEYYKIRKQLSPEGGAKEKQVWGIEDVCDSRNGEKRSGGGVKILIFLSSICYLDSIFKLIQIIIYYYFDSNILHS